MSETEERVAKAIDQCEMPDGDPFGVVVAMSDYCEGNRSVQDICKIVARAAIAAMPAWQTIATAPKDGTSILAVVAPSRGRHLEHHAGRMFVIHHGGVTASGFDLGWSVYPGFGGASDHDFTCWQAISPPEAPAPIPHDGEKP